MFREDILNIIKNHTSYYTNIDVYYSSKINDLDLDLLDKIEISIEIESMFDIKITDKYAKQIYNDYGTVTDLINSLKTLMPKQFRCEKLNKLENL